METKSPKIIVEKSTVPVKTADAMARVMAASCAGTDFQVLSNPEFLAEGTAIDDLFKPDRVLVGGPVTPQGNAAVQYLANVYRRWVGTEQVLTTNFQVLSNPEFLAEGTAMDDLFKPDRVLVGGAETPAGHAAVQCLANVYRRCALVRSRSQ